MSRCKPSLRKAALLVGATFVATFLNIHLASAQTNPAVGTFNGRAGALRVVLHIAPAGDGKFGCTLDSPDQGGYGMPCTDLQLNDNELSFAISNLRITWKGTVEEGGAKLVGTWTQGASGPLTFTRDPFVAAAQPAPIDGFWLGTLQVGEQALRIQIAVKTDNAGKHYCMLDSLDQRGFGVECNNLSFVNDEFKFDVPVVSGTFAGKLSGDKNSIDGLWSQSGNSQPFRFERKAERTRPTPVKPPSYDAAIAPVSVEDMQAVLARDLEQALKTGALAPATNGGVTVGVYRNGVRRVFSFGTAKDDSIFEIGSISKTFTGLVLAQMAEQGKLKADEPVRNFLPPGTVSKPEGEEITLFDLVTQHSGLPRMPSNFTPRNPADPYADYDTNKLYEYMNSQGVAKPADAGFLYSNVGLGLLGKALANRAEKNYEALIKQYITGPLCMHDTVVTIPEKLQPRFIQGYGAGGRPASPWSLSAVVGAGGVRSTAHDMLNYLEAQLDSKKTCKEARRDPNTRTLPAAIAKSQQLQSDAGAGMKVGYAWLYNEQNKFYWHNGGTGGFNSYAAFKPEDNYAIVVLFNTGGKAFADRVGQHIAQRLMGKPAISLGD